MEIFEILKNQFPKINNVFFEKENQVLFLRIEVLFNNLNDVCIISKEISNFLDQKDLIKDEYFLDIFSSGLDKKIEVKDLVNYIDKNIKVILNHQIKNFDFFEGILLSFEIDKLLIKWNSKGQFRKQEIMFANIASINESFK